MPRFTLFQMMMAIPLVGIGFLFTQIEGCTKRYAAVESLSFSSDESRILVTKLNGRDAQTPGKRYMADVARTVSWLDARDGARLGIVHQDYAPGNCGTARLLWHKGRVSTTCFGLNDQVAVIEFGGGKIFRNQGNGKPNIDTSATGHNLAVSRSGRLLATSGNWQLTIIDTSNHRVVMNATAYDIALLHGSLMSFTADESQIAVVDEEGLHVWDIASGQKVSTVFKDKQTNWTSMAAVPDGTVFVSGDKGLKRYDLSGKVIASFPNLERGICSVSADGRILAFASYGDTLAIDLGSNKLLRTFPLSEASCVAISSDGGKVAVGDHNGGVSMFDTQSGNRLWHASPPGRFRWPWPVPFLFCAGWIFVVLISWRFAKRFQTNATP